MAPSLRILIEALRVDAARVASSKKAFERRPCAGGYGQGRRPAHDGGIAEASLGGHFLGIVDGMYRFRR